MRRHRLRPLLAALACLAWFTPAAADIAVIVSRDSPLETLDRHEITDLYLGRTRSVRLGGQLIGVLIVEHPADSALREAFYRTLTGMRIERVNSYWARLRFSGAVPPPQPMRDDHAVIEAVSQHRYAVGYVNAAEVDATVRTVHLIRE